MRGRAGAAIAAGVLTVSVGVAVGGGIPAHAAAAGSITVTDANGDVTNAKGDILSASVNATATSSTFSMTLKAPGNPLNDVNWANGNSSAIWLMDTDFDGQPETDAALTVFDHAFVAALIGPRGQITCLGKGSMSGSTLTASFAGSCPRIPSFVWEAGMLYDSTPSNHSDQSQLDQAPNGVPSAVTPSIRAGYVMLGADGKSYGFGNAPHWSGTVAHAAAVALRRDGTGEWLTDSSGHVFTRGRAAYKGGSPALRGGRARAARWRRHPLATATGCSRAWVARSRSATRTLTAICAARC